MKLSPAKSIRGSVTVPGDKSISHRSVMLGSIARGTTEIHGFLEGADCLSTISCFHHMGVDIENKTAWSQSTAKASAVFLPPQPPDCGNTAHHPLISGSWRPRVFCCSHRDASIQKRPWAGSSPLISMMGADIKSTMKMAARRSRSPENLFPGSATTLPWPLPR